MLYNEFVEGTGCKDNEHNYRVYKNLEIMYMNSDMSKAEIYEYGKKLVDNSKTVEQIKAENKIKDEIKSLNEQIKYEQEEIAYRKHMNELWSEDKAMVDWNNNVVRSSKNNIRRMKAEIRELKWVLS